MVIETGLCDISMHMCVCVIQCFGFLYGLFMSTNVCLCRTYYCSAGHTSQMIVMISRIFCSRSSDCQRRSCHVVRHIQSSCHAVPTQCCTHSVIGKKCWLSREMCHWHRSVIIAINEVNVCPLACWLLVFQCDSGDNCCYSCLVFIFVRPARECIELESNTTSSFLSSGLAVHVTGVTPTARQAVLITHVRHWL